jgi:hypothetical protein
VDKKMSNMGVPNKISVDKSALLWGTVNGPLCWFIAFFITFGVLGAGPIINYGFTSHAVIASLVVELGVLLGVIAFLPQLLAQRKRRKEALGHELSKQRAGQSSVITLVVLCFLFTIVIAAVCALVSISSS